MYCFLIHIVDVYINTDNHFELAIVAIYNVIEVYSKYIIG